MPTLPQASDRIVGGEEGVHGFTDVDGTRPDCRRYLAHVVDAGRPAGDEGYG